MAHGTIWITYIFSRAIRRGDSCLHVPYERIIIKYSGQKGHASCFSLGRGYIISQRLSRLFYSPQTKHCWGFRSQSVFVYLWYHLNRSHQLSRVVCRIDLGSILNNRCPSGHIMVNGYPSPRKLGNGQSKYGWRNKAPLLLIPTFIHVHNWRTQLYQSFRIQAEINCNSIILVHTTNYSSCGTQFTGETKRSLPWKLSMPKHIYKSGAPSGIQNYTYLCECLE